MLATVLRRVLVTIPALLGVSVVIFVMIIILPGDPLAALLGPQFSTPEARMALANKLGMNDPVPVQYLRWLGNIVTGDLGFSYIRQRSVSELIFTAFGRTLVLAGAAAIFSIILGLILGTIAAIKPGKVLDRVISVVAIGGMSIPSFWLAIILIVIFSTTLQMFPSSGMAEMDKGFGEFFGHLILPAFATGAVTIGLTSRMTRSSLIETFGEDFVVTLRAKGLNKWQILKHVIKNAAPSILTMIGLQVGYLLGGSVLVETIFAWPGIGVLIYQAILSRDLIVIQDSLLVIAVTFVVINLIVDLLQILVNPRLRKRATT
jgi:peptide/nickel transport system permease protein